MDWLIKVIVIWLSLDIVLIATVWYASVTIQQFRPDWWRQIVAEGNDLDF